MRMNGGALFFSAIGLAAALILLIYDERRRQHELLAMERMRGSMLYYDLYPLVAYARQHNLDRVQVERSRVVFYGVCPPGRMGEFVLAERGYRPLNARPTLALSCARAPATGCGVMPFSGPTAAGITAINM